MVSFSRQRLGGELRTDVVTVDICIQTPMISLEEMHPLAEALDKRMLP